jgi:hypothetical protein
MFFNGALHASGTTNTEFSAVMNYMLLGGNWTGYACDFQFLTYAKNTAAYSAPTARLPFSLAGPTATPCIEDGIKPL